MIRQVLLATLLGMIALAAYLTVLNGVFRFESRMNMKQLAGEREVYEVLRQHVTEPGRYIVNPELTADWRFPEDMPVYSVMFGGFTHGAAARSELTRLAAHLVALLAASILLCFTADSIRRRYWNKVLIYVLLGALVTANGCAGRYGIGSYPPRDVALQAAADLLAWAVVGLAVAWIFKPRRGGAAA